MSWPSQRGEGLQRQHDHHFHFPLHFSSRQVEKTIGRLRCCAKVDKSLYCSSFRQECQGGQDCRFSNGAKKSIIFITQNQLKIALSVGL